MQVGRAGHRLSAGPHASGCTARFTQHAFRCHRHTGISAVRRLFRLLLPSIGLLLTRFGGFSFGRAWSRRKDEVADVSAAGSEAAQAS